MEKETPQEVAGKRIRNVGIVIGILALLAAPEFVLPGAALAAGGIIFERTGKKKA